eukprot:scpid79322/ scgid31166/ 
MGNCVIYMYVRACECMERIQVCIKRARSWWHAYLYASVLTRAPLHSENVSDKEERRARRQLWTGTPQALDTECGEGESAKSTNPVQEGNSVVSREEPTVLHCALADAVDYIVLQSSPTEKANQSSTSQGPARTSDGQELATSCGYIFPSRVIVADVVEVGGGDTVAKNADNTSSANQPDTTPTWSTVINVAHEKTVTEV